MQRREITFDDHVTISQYSSLPQVCPRDVTLNLSKMDLNDDDVTALCAYLVKHPEINELNVQVNDITDAGAIQLATNTTLLQLNISFNRITEKGLVALMYNGRLYSILAGAHVIEKLPARCEGEHRDITQYRRGSQYERYQAFIKCGLSHPVLSLKQLSIFAVQLPPNKLKEICTIGTSGLEPKEKLYCDLFQAPEFYDLKRMGAFCTQIAEYMYPTCQRK